MDTIFLNGKFLAQRTTGVQRVALQWVSALDKRVESDRLVLLAPAVRIHEPRLKNIEVKTLGPRGMPLHLWEQTLLPWAARRGLLVNLAGSAPALAARSANVIHDAAVFDVPEAYKVTFVIWYRWLFRRLASKGAALATVSRFSQRQLASALSLPQDKITVIPNGADHLDTAVSNPSLLQGWGLRPGGYVLAVGSFNPTKNLPALIESFPLSGQEHIRLVIAGAGNPNVFAHHKSKASSNVLYVGAVDDEQLVTLYEHALLLAFPSSYEGFGLPPLEAMRRGCPVVATPCGAIPEVLGEAAYYAKSTQVQDLESAIQVLASNTPLRLGHARQGRIHSDKFRWADTAPLIEDFMCTRARKDMPNPSREDSRR
jgi:glycosyltransferase involved in cell wall biosynthesis